MEATLIRDGQLHQEVREMFVPQPRTCSMYKPVFKPGETGHIQVDVSDASGNPTQGIITLTAYALPTSGYAMYAPEVKAISNEMELKIQDGPLK